ncbi:MAG TPA: SDR family oxidoreductase [Chloroflexota bacterium]|jgi:NAD(P)-dependent dehydrogenase (short-subunit alcohol dehydrogenase family)
MPCSHKHAVVTGASTGIGRATALRLAARGYHVFATVRRPADADALRGAAPSEITPLLMDVTAPEQIARTVAAVRAHVGVAGLDALVNNAGVGLAWPLELVPLEAFRAQMAVNVDGQLAVTQACLPLLRQARGRVVLIGSIGDRISMPFAGPLTASKHAVLALADTLRQEVAPWGIRVVLVEPASIRTDAVGKLERDAAAALEQFGPEGRALYGAAFQAMTARAVAREMHGSPPEVVAATVAQALESPAPRARYLVGKDARLLAAVAKLPPFILDAVRRRFFGLPRPGSLARAAVR